MPICRSCRGTVFFELPVLRFSLIADARYCAGCAFVFQRSPGLPISRLMTRSHGAHCPTRGSPTQLPQFNLFSNGTRFLRTEHIRNVLASRRLAHGTDWVELDPALALSVGINGTHDVTNLRLCSVGQLLQPAESNHSSTSAPRMRSSSTSSQRSKIHWRM